jgi:hypothetical protein
MTPARAAPAVTAADAALVRDGAALFTTNPSEERWPTIQKRLLGPAYQDAGRALALVGALAPLPNVACAMNLLRADGCPQRAFHAGGYPRAAELLADVASRESLTPAEAKMLELALKRTGSGGGG